eukprot:166067_1
MDLSILNIDKKLSTLSAEEFILIKNLSHQSYIVSDEDDQLLFLVKFKEAINLRSVTFYASPNPPIVSECDENLNELLSGPKEVNLYIVKDLNLSFEDIDSLQPNYSGTCESNKLASGHKIKLSKLSAKKAFKFKRVKFLVVFIKSNQNNTEKTYLNGITFNKKIKFIDEQNLIKTQSENSVSEQIKILLNMGFDANKARVALEMTDNHVNDAITHLVEAQNLMLCEEESKQISNTSCDIKQCDQLTKLLHLFTSKHTEVDQAKMIQLLNLFHHLNFEHSSDEDFECIYHKFAVCDIKQCRLFERNHRSRERFKYDENKKKLYGKDLDDKQIMYLQIMDKIHCFFVHSFDIGRRLRRDEKDIIYASINKPETINESLGESVSLQLLTALLCPKHELLYNTVETKQDDAQCNKFCTNLGIVPNMTEEKQNVAEQINDQYSVGIRFWYWEMDYLSRVPDKDDVYNFGYKNKDWYVPKKFGKFKDELLNNDIVQINVKQFINEINKASLHVNSRHCKNMEPDYPRFHDLTYGYIVDIPIQTEHLLAVMVYCNYDTLQRKFCETMRRTHFNEAVQSVIDRHKHFHNLGRLLREAIELHGTRTCNGDIHQFYHGISKQLMFDSLYPSVYGPLSTTSEFAVAVNFANTSGLILTFYSNDWLQYFDCSWISDFANERELLFIGGIKPILISNIKNAITAVDHIVATKAISIIDRMTYGRFYEDNEKVSEKLLRLGHWRTTLVNAQPFEPSTKTFVTHLIKHEIKVNNNDSKYSELKYLDPYIAKVLHNICINKKTITINFETMNADVASKYSNGYQGYLFLKLLLCEQNCEMIKFDIVTDLYPNIES